MLYYPEVIVFLWLVPVFFLLFLPLLMTSIIVSLRLIRGEYSFRALLNKEKRKHHRIHSNEDIFAEITLGNTTCTGIVCNISQLGISLKHLPDMFSDEMEKLTVVIKKYGVHFNLLVKPKWVSLTKSGKQMGAEIDVAPADWSRFLLQTETMRRPESA